MRMLNLTRMEPSEYQADRLHHAFSHDTRLL